jgi:hypothetical protein
MAGNDDGLSTVIGKSPEEANCQRECRRNCRLDCRDWVELEDCGRHPEWAEGGIRHTYIRDMSSQDHDSSNLTIQS